MASLWIPNWDDEPAAAEAAPAVSTVKAAEPIETRAEEYRSPGENSSPAGETIPAGIGAASYDGKIVWFSGFPGNNATITEWSQLLATEQSSAARCSFVMLFKDAIFADSFSLVKMYADEQLIISNSEPHRQSDQIIRFYDGMQTAVDPVLTAALGADKASAWPGFVYAVFENFDCGPYGNRVPLIRAVLAGGVSAVPGGEETSTLTFGATTGYTNIYMTVDRIRKHAYVIHWNAEDDTFISVIDIHTNLEISRAAVQTTNYTVLEYTVALDGSDWLVAAVHETSGTAYYDLVLVNAYTGEVADRLEALVDGIEPFESRPRFPVMVESGTATKYFMICGSIYNGAATDSFLNVVLVDVTNGTMEYILHPYINPAPGSHEPYSIAVGPVSGGVSTFFYTNENSGVFDVYKVELTTSGYSASLFYTEALSGNPNFQGVAYDSTDGGLLVYWSQAFPTPDAMMKKLDSDGATVWTATSPMRNLAINFSTAYDDFLSLNRPGYAIAADDGGSNDVYQINLYNGTVTLLLDKSGYLDEGIFGFYDQYEGTYVEDASGAGQINRITQGDVTPNTVDLVDIFTQLSTYQDRFDVDDLNFTGFPGNETYGLKLENDTTIDNLENSIAELFDVKIVESDGERDYIYPPRDGSFAIDVVLSAENFVERGTETIVKTFGAGEDEFYACSVSYYDVDADYKRLEQTYQRPIGVYDVTRSRKKRTINSVLSLTASQAAQLSQIAVFRSVLGNESYYFALTPAMMHVEPADLVQFDFRGFTTVARIREATLQANYTQEVGAYQYLQFVDATYTGVTLDRPETSDVGFHARMIYLDIPLISYAHDTVGGSLVHYMQIAGYSTAPMAATLYRAADGLTYQRIGSLFWTTVVVGTITGITGTSSDPFTVDTASEIEVLVNGGDINTLETITDDEFDDAVNLAAIGRNGRWVLILFKTVSISNGRATLSDILWGYHGSEVWVDELAVGDQFVRIETGKYTRFQAPVANMDDPYYYKVASSKVSVGFATTQIFNATAVAETPYAPVNLSAVIVTGDDIELSWDYRSRIAAGLNPATHGEDSLSFEIDIIGTGSPEVLRTLTSPTNSVIYTAAQITTDFGATPDFLTFRVYMMSAIVGRGYAGEGTIQLDTEGTPIGLLLSLTYA